MQPCFHVLGERPANIVLHQTSEPGLGVVAFDRCRLFSESINDIEQLRLYEAADVLFKAYEISLSLEFNLRLSK